MKIFKNINLADLTEYFGASILILVFSMLLVSVVLFFFNINVSGLNLVFALVLTLIFMMIFTKRFYLSVFCILLCCLLIYISYFLASGIIDISFDGNAYHIPAVKYLAQGWNPLRFDFIPKHKWIEYFPKGTWIIEASFVNFFLGVKNAFGAKSFNFIMSICAFLFSYTTILKLNITQNRALAALISYLGVFNPINLSQLNTFMVDGVLSSTIIIFICRLALFLKEGTKFAAFLFFLSICVAINIKFTAIAYLCVLLSGALFYLKNGREKIKFCKISLCAILFGAFVLGFNPYSIGLYKYKNPVYPIGSKDITIVGNNIPESLEGKNVFQKLIISTYSKVSNDDYELVSPLNPVFEKITNETRFCGWGVLWGIIFTFSILSLAVLCKTKDFKYLLLATTTLFVSVIINPECWWARFVPQAFLIPVFILLHSLKNKYYPVCTILIILMILNSYFVQIH